MDAREPAGADDRGDERGLPRTELPGGETVTAEVSFAVDPDETGNYYIQYKPETLDTARGIWQYTIK